MYINNEQQRDSTSGRHSRVDQSDISTAMSETNAYLAQLYINSDQQRKPLQAKPPPRFANFLGKRKYNWHSRISTTNSKAKALLDGTVVSTRAVYQPRSAKRTHIWHSCISTAISKAKPHRHSRARVFFCKAKIQLAQPYINNKQQIESTSGRQIRVDQNGMSTAIIETKT